MLVALHSVGCVRQRARRGHEPRSRANTPLTREGPITRSTACEGRPKPDHAPTHTEHLTNSRALHADAPVTPKPPHRGMLAVRPHKPDGEPPTQIEMSWTCRHRGRITKMQFGVSVVHRAPKTAGWLAWLGCRHLRFACRPPRRTHSELTWPRSSHCTVKDGGG